ncbi:hypothetical protein [Halolactibacillus halophilus]|nr:hypothetical protein [Halolactibacillus halophilus]
MNEETYFNMSAIAANIHLFDNLKEERESRNYVTKQQVFFSNKLDVVGTTPLANPTEISLSIFNIASSSPSFTIKHLLDYLTRLGMSKDQLFFRVANQKDILNAYLEEGILEDNIFVWNNLEEFNIGKHRPKGYYTYPYYKYKNGCVPLGSISFINYNGYWTADVAIFQERLSLIINNLDKVVEIDAICHIYEYLSKIINLKDTSIMRITLLLRSISFLFKDGLTELSSNYHGHFLKKLIREIGAELNGRRIDFDQQQIIYKLLLNSLAIQGYKLEENCKSFEEIFNKINYYSYKISTTIEKVNENFQKNGDIDIPYLSQTMGIKPDWILKHSNMNEDFIIQARKYVKQRSSIRNKALSLDPSNKVNITELLSEPSIRQ